MPPEYPHQVTVKEEVTRNTLHQGESSFIPRLGDHLAIGGSAWRVQCVVVALPQAGSIKPRSEAMVWVTRLDPSVHDTTGV
jgi:hypothetical protein